MKPILGTSATWILLVCISLHAARAAEPPAWVQPMKEVRAKFTGTPGTLALFGDSITVSLAFWAGLEGEPKGMSPEAAAALQTVKGHQRPECWRQWRGPEFGNEGRMTIRWAHENVDAWLKKLNPEAAVILFGSNDLSELGVMEFEQKTGEVVDRCLKNGTVVLLTTLPPRSGLVEKSKQFAEAARRVAEAKKVPLIDYQAEILKRRPEDWDGSLAKFKDTPGSEYEVPTLIGRDGVHPSNPQAHRDLTDESLSRNGYLLRSYVTLLAYADVIKLVLSKGGRLPPPAPPAFPFDQETARQYQRAYAKAIKTPLEFSAVHGIELVFIPPGKFRMGSPHDELGRKDDESSHEVTITRPFYLGRFEVKFGQFRRWAEATRYVTDGEKRGGGHAHDAHAVWEHRPGTNWRKPGYAGPFELADDHPVVHVSHNDALAFCRWLTERERSNGGTVTFTLPSEAQWEWACRAGSGGRFSWGDGEDTTGKAINAGDRSLKRIHPEWPRSIMPMDDGFPFAAPVARFQPNGFGLFDMLGNVWEFCSTRSGPYPAEAVTDPGDLSADRGFAVRGGGWSNVAADCRCATRNADPPDFCHSNLGFRVALLLPAIEF